MQDVVKLSLAYDFSARKHSGQRRKGADAEPYINHLTETARLVAEATDGKDLDVIIAAVLHDTLEDTDTTKGELEALFGRHIAAIVAEVSDDESLPKAERKRLEIEHAATASRDAKLVKLADKTANVGSLLRSPPESWSEQRIREYAEWAGKVIAGCRGTNTKLEAQFDAAAHLVRDRYQQQV